MLRRSLSMLVMLGYLAGQLAAVPHAHADDPAHEHQLALPHIHLADLGGVAHGHKHGHGHVHRHEAPASQREGASHHDRLQGSGDHDEDAIYLPTPAYGSAISGADQVKVLATPAFLHFVANTSFLGALAADHAALHRPPCEQASACTFCLSMRALRI
jgi:hypothetical protein